MAGIMSFLARPEFAMWLSGVGRGLTQASQPGGQFDMSQTNAMLMHRMAQEKQQEKMAGLMESVGQNLTPEQRQYLEAAGPETGMEVLGQRLFQQPQNQPSAVQQYEYYRQQAEASGQRPMSFMEFQQALRQSGATSVSVDTGDQGPQVGTIPQGYQLMQTPEGAWQMAPIPGGPAAMEAEKAEKAGAARAETAAKYGGIVLEDIGRIKKKLETFGLPETGPAAALLQKVPGTDAYDVRALTNTIKANIGFDRLQQMREASPTGGALGQVSEREIDFLQSTLGNLDQAQSEEQFVQNLDRLEQIYREIMRKAAAYPNAAEFGFAGGAEQPAQDSAAEKTIDGQRYIKRGGQWYRAR